MAINWMKLVPEDEGMKLVPEDEQYEILESDNNRAAEAENRKESGWSRDAQHMLFA